ncbi:hypothetical protein K490DRAFT_43685, partial [Saccharata proteae CBS 121410]
ANTVLQDPSVASAPLEKRIAFLQSKNLTQEEIDASLARAGEPGAPAAPPAGNPTSGVVYQQPPAAPPGYGAYPGYWQQPPPPEVPKRDWRDWFIMATVLGGVGYGLYFTTKRYILPMIAPPTPPQLEQDKAAIDKSFGEAFDLLEQLSTDTAALKQSEEARTQRLDTAISEMETVINSLKDSFMRRDADSRRLDDDVRGLRDLIPKALDAHKESTDNRLKDLSTELKSLKTLVGNRVGASATSPAGRGTPAGVNMFGSQGTASVNGSGPATPTSTQLQDAPVATSGVGGVDGQENASAPDRNQASSPYGRLASGRAKIPAWQMAASKSKQEDKKDTSESGTVTEAST